MHEGGGSALSALPRVVAKLLVLLGILLAVAGCSLFRGPPPETFDLTGPESVKVGGGTAAQILVPEPIALKALDSDRIVVSKGAKITYYPDAQWPDRLPKLLQSRTIEAFERSRKVRAVGRPGEGLSIDYQVVTEIRAFEYRVDGDGKGLAHVEIAAKILDDRNGRVVSNRVFTGEAPVAKDTAAAVVDGLNAAISRVLVDIVRWTVTRV
jgi:cholesterol transport system auxiliary component